MAIAFLMPIAAAFLGVSFLLGNTSRSAWRLTLNLVLAVGIGLGTFPLLLFAWLQVAGAPGTAYWLVESSLALGLIAILATVRWRRNRPHQPPPGPRLPARPALSRAQRVIVACFLIVVAMSAVSLAYWTLLMPHGGWDAWAIWNLRARFIFRAGDEWRQAFASFMAHTDYPLLVPLAVVRGWASAAAELQAVPILLALLFAASTVVLLIAAVAEQRGMTHGLLAGMVLLATPGYLEQSAVQTADVPLAFYFLATVVLLTFFERTGRPQPLVLAGVTTGLASWTKNEGLLFLIAALAVSLTLTMKQRSYRPGFKQALLLLSGAAPALLTGWWFRETVAPPNDLMSQPIAQMLTKLADPARYAQILLATLSEVWRHYFWLPVLAAGLLICGYDRQLLLRAPLAILSTVMLGYLAIYLITPLDLGYHLGSSLERLVLHLWPIGLFVFFSGVRAVSLRPAA